MGVILVLSGRCGSNEFHVLDRFYFLDGLWMLCIVRTLGVYYFLGEGSILYIGYVLD